MGGVTPKIDEEIVNYNVFDNTGCESGNTSLFRHSHKGVVGTNNDVILRW